MNRAVLMLAVLLMGLATVISATAADPVTTERYIVALKGESVAAAFGEFPRASTTRAARSGRERLDPDSPQVRAYAGEVSARQDDYISRMRNELGRDFNVVDRYEYVLNGILVELTAAEAAQIRQLGFVRDVEREEPMILHTDRGPQFINADTIWDGSAAPSGVGNEGEGMVIGIVDSGVNYQHDSFANTGADGYTHTNPLGSDFLGVCDGGNTDPNFTCTDKLIGGYTLVGGDPDDGNGHGSHTASTAGGNYLDDSPFTDVGTGTEYPAGSISGVARHANLINYKACDGGCFNLAAAFDQAVQDGIVDTMNFSIGPNAGGTAQDPWSTTNYHLAMLDAVNAGIFVAASAGNTSDSLPDPVGHVANHAPWIMTVANSSHDRTQKNEVTVTGPGTPPASVSDLYGLEGTGAAFVADINAPVVHAADVGDVEGCSAFPAGSFAASVALISRGSCTFADKVNNADDAGAVAVVVYNDVSDAPIVMGGLEPTTIPSVMVGNADGLAIAGFIDSNPTATIFVDDESVYSFIAESGDILSSGSLVGPNEQFDITAPDITAPGTRILAAYRSGLSSDIAILSGTSMSSPHVAGSAALVMSEHPDWTVQEIKSAMMLTADPTTLNANGSAMGTPDEVGNGMTDLSQAAMSGLVMHETYDNFLAADPDIGGDPGTLNIPSMRRNACGTDCSWTRTVRSTQDTGTSWTVVGSGDMDVTVTPSSFELLPGDVLFNGGFETSSEPVSSFQTLEITADGVPAGSDYSFGEVILSEMGGTLPDARMTIAVRQ